MGIFREKKMGFIKKALHTGSLAFLVGAMACHVGLEASIDFKYIGANSREYRPIHETVSMRTVYPILHDVDHDGVPDVVQVKAGIYGGTPGSGGTICTVLERPPTKEEIDWFRDTD